MEGISGPSNILPVVVLQEALPREECQRLIELSESLGYTRTTVDRPYRTTDHAWWPDQEFTDRMWTLLSPFLPASLSGYDLRGLRPKWRFDKYFGHGIIEPHQDGVGYPVVGTDWVTFGTVLIYLNEEFEGGITRYYTIEQYKRYVALKNEGKLDEEALTDKYIAETDPVMTARPVTGTIIIHTGNPAHVGCPAKGTKYILRTMLAVEKQREVSRDSGSEGDMNDDS